MCITVHTKVSYCIVGILAGINFYESVVLSGVTIVTPIRNDPGRVRSPHANVWGRLVPNHLPMGKKAGIRSQIDLPNSELHCATVKVRLECAGEMSAVNCLGPFCSCHNIIILHLATHSS